MGTPSYLAPEVLQSLESSDGYGVECDWWSLGIIAYELMLGVTPFEGDTQKETYDNIMNYEVCMFVRIFLCFFSVRNNSQPLAIFRPISAFGRPKSILIGHISHTFSMGQHCYSL